MLQGAEGRGGETRVAYVSESSNIAMSEIGVRGEGVATSTLAEERRDRERATEKQRGR